MEPDREITPKEIEKIELDRNQYHNGNPTPYEREVEKMTSYIFPEKH